MQLLLILISPYAQVNYSPVLKVARQLLMPCGTQRDPSVFSLLLQPDCPKPECFETLSAMELAEQITLLDHVVFRSIPYE